MDEQFRLLMVCHANLCRSPMAERLSHRSLELRLGKAAKTIDVSGAGTHARADQPMHPLAVEVLREHGADDTGFRSRRLTEELVTRADLVLTATRQQRAASVGFNPAAVRRTFTIRQFGRYAKAVPAGTFSPCRPPEQQLRKLVDEMSVVRGKLPVAAPEADDLPDPVNLPIDAFRRCAAEIQSVVDVMLGLIAPS